VTKKLMFYNADGAKSFGRKTFGRNTFGRPSM
jgi:hypothetical protein